MAIPPNPPQPTEPPGGLAHPPVGEHLSGGGPQSIVIEDSGGALSRLLGWTLAWTGWLGMLVALMVIFYLWSGRMEYYDTSEGINQKFFSGSKHAKDKIAIIHVTGVIYGGNGFVKQQIDRIREDESVKGVVLRVNSPGGTVAGSDFIFHHLKRLRDERDLPLVVSMGSIAASGGYYVAMAVGDQVKSIYAEPTTTTGSIGVIIPHYDMSGLLERLDVEDDSIASHPRKQMLSMTRPIPEDHRELLQDHVDELFELFKERVKEGRPVYRKDQEALTELATGEIFTAPKAKHLGLVDEIGFLEDAVKRATDLAGLNEKYVRVVRYTKPPALLEIPLVAQSSSLDERIKTLLELSIPRAYYLATSLPPLVSGRH